MSYGMIRSINKSFEPRSIIFWTSEKQIQSSWHEMRVMDRVNGHGHGWSDPYNFSMGNVQRKIVMGR